MRKIIMNQYEMKKLAYQSNLRNRALQVLLYLIDRTNKERTCFPAVRTIARELHISVSTVKRAMQELVESGYVTKESRFREENGGQTSNLYTLYFSKNLMYCALAASIKIRSYLSSSLKSKASFNIKVILFSRPNFRMFFLASPYMVSFLSMVVILMFLSV